MSQKSKIMIQTFLWPLSSVHSYIIENTHVILPQAILNSVPIQTDNQFPITRIVYRPSTLIRPSGRNLNFKQKYLQNNLQGAQGYQPILQLQPGVSGLGGIQQNIINPAQIRAANTEWFNATGTGQIIFFYHFPKVKSISELMNN